MKENIEVRNIYDMVKDGYQIFSSYVARERLVPNLEDGLKPVYRRVILAAYEACPRNFIKTATLAGHTLGHYHPHSLDSVEDVITELVHMGILEGDGAFGSKSLTGNHSGAAASRYTEVRLNQKYADFFDMLMKYVNKVDGEMDVKESAYIPTPLPILCNSGSFSLAPGLMTKLPAFTYKSMLEAYKANDPHKLKSTFGYKVMNEECLNQIWEYGRATIWYSLSVYKGDLEGYHGVFIQGSPELFIPNLDCIAEWKNAGLVFVNDISSGTDHRLFIGLNKGVRTLSQDTVFKAIRAASVKRDSILMLALVDGVARPIGLKAWIKGSLNNFHKLIETYKQDIISIQEERIRVMSEFDKVRKYIIDHIKDTKLTAETIAKDTKVDLDIVKKIDAMSVKAMRQTDPQWEIKVCQKKIKEAQKISAEVISEEFINTINIEPAFECKYHFVTHRDLKASEGMQETINIEREIEEDVIG